MESKLVLKDFDLWQRILAMFDSAWIGNAEEEIRSEMEYCDMLQMNFGPGGELVGFAFVSSGKRIELSDGSSFLGVYFGLGASNGKYPNQLKLGFNLICEDIRAWQAETFEKTVFHLLLYG